MTLLRRLNWLLVGLSVLHSMAGCGQSTTPPNSSRPASRGVPQAMRTLSRTVGDLSAESREEPEKEMPLPLRPHTEWTLDETAADSLSRIGAPAVPALVNSLSDRDAKRRLRAVQILAGIGSDASPAVPFLVEALRDPDPKVRKAAAWTLGQIGPNAAEAVPALMELLQAEMVSPAASGVAPSP